MRDLRFVHNLTVIPKNMKLLVEQYNKMGKEFNIKHKELREDKDKYIVEKGNKWKIFKNVWLELSDFRCPICESKISRYGDIEHFRPKEHYWWLAYDYKNYSISCNLCNRTLKHTAFPLLNETQRATFESRNETEIPLLYNPLKDNPLDLFEIEFIIKGGKITLQTNVLSNDKSSITYKKAETTITTYQLNNQNNKYPEILDRNYKFGDLLIHLAKSRTKYKENKFNKAAKIRYVQELKRIKEQKLGFVKLITAGNCIVNT